MNYNTTRPRVLEIVAIIIRGQQRATHSDSERVSGRARELAERGFYFLKYHPSGAKPSDVWDILPEDTRVWVFNGRHQRVKRSDKWKPLDQVIAAWFKARLLEAAPIPA